MKTIGARREGEKRALLGFSAGGGFVLRFAGDARASLFDRFILVSPGLLALTRPNGGGLVSVALPRMMVLQGLSRLGIDAFDHLPVIAFGVSPEPRYGLTRVWTYRMARSFNARQTFLKDLQHAPGPVIVLAGAADEVLFTDKYEALLRPARPDIDITLLPGFNHTDMVTKPEALLAIADKALKSAQ
jgi:pimeloyl-ACP methyl ester carboxylesterase